MRNLTGGILIGMIVGVLFMGVLIFNSGGAFMPRVKDLENKVDLIENRVDSISIQFDEILNLGEK